MRAVLPAIKEMSINIRPVLQNEDYWKRNLVDAS